MSAHPSADVEVVPAQHDRRPKDPGRVIVDGRRQAEHNSENLRFRPPDLFEQSAKLLRDPREDRFWPAADVESAHTLGDDVGFEVRDREADVIFTDVGDENDAEVLVEP